MPNGYTRRLTAGGSGFDGHEGREDMHHPPLEILRGWVGGVAACTASVHHRACGGTYRVTLAFIAS